MRTVLLTLTILILTGCTGGEKVTIEIKDRRDTEETTPDVTSHKDGDVEIYRSTYLGDTYTVIMYREEEGELKSFQAYIQASQNFDEATYQWQNDTELQFILFSSENGQVEKYTLTGEGSGTTLVKHE